MNRYRNLGAVSTLPEHYLTPMTQAQIQAFIQKTYNQSICKGKSGWEGINCTLMNNANAIVEGANMMYANSLISYDQLQAYYRQASDLYARARYGTKDFITQLKEVGFIAASAITGIFKGGPLGFFAGGASATAAIIAQNRAARAARSDAYYNSISTTQSQVAANAQNEIEWTKFKGKLTSFVKDNKEILMIGGGVVIVGGLLLLMD